MNLKKILFSTKKEYFITSMICCLKPETDITNKKKVEKMKELSKIAEKLEKMNLIVFFS